jgi:hypothetical protein
LVDEERQNQTGPATEGAYQAVKGPARRRGRRRRRRGGEAVIPHRTRTAVFVYIMYIED